MGDRLRAAKPPQHFTKPLKPTQPPTLSGREMSRLTGQSAAMLCGWGVSLKAGMAHSMWINVWVKLCDPSLTRANLSAFEISIAHIIKHYANILFTYLVS